MTAVLDLINALSNGTVGVVSVLFEHLGGFITAVGDLVQSSSANADSVPLTPLEPATPIAE